MAVVFAALLFHLHVFLSTSLKAPLVAQRTIAGMTREIRNQGGPVIRIEDYRSFEQPSYQNEESSFENANSYFFKVIAAMPKPEDGHLYLFIVAPQRDRIGQEIPNGAAGLCEIGKQTPAAYVTYIDEPIAKGAGNYGGPISRYAAMHEVLHVFGAQHLSGINVMSPGNFTWVAPWRMTLPIKKETLKQIKVCITLP